MALRSMRKGFFSAIFLGLLVLGGVSLVLSDSTGTLRGTAGNAEVAKIGNTTIKLADFNARVSTILRNQQMDVETAYKIGLIDNILTNEIFETLVKMDAADTGIRIEDRLVAQQIKTLIAPLKAEGVSDKAALKKFLEMQGLTERALVQILRDDLATKLVKSTIASAAYAPKSLVNALQSYEMATRNIDVIFKADNSFAITDKPSDKDLEEYYTSQHQNFMVPELRDITVAILDSTKIKPVIVTDNDIQTAYTTNKEAFAIPESVYIEQVVVDQKEKADSIAKEANAGNNLKDATKTVTGRTSSFQTKAEFTKDGLPSQLADAVFTAQAGSIIGPVQTSLGYHVVKVLEKTNARIADFEEVKDKIKNELTEEKNANAIMDITADIEDRLANGETYESLAKDYPMTTTTLSAQGENSALVKSTDFKEKEIETIIKKAFSLKDSTPSELVDLDSSQMFSVRADKIQPATPKPFAEVKSDLLKLWTADNQMQNNLIASQKNLGDIQSNARSFADLSSKTVTDFSRDQPSGIATDIHDRILNASIGKPFLALSKEKKGTYIIRVNSVDLPKNIKPDTEAENRIKTNIMNAAYMDYMSTLQKKYNVIRYDDILNRVYGQKASSEE